MMVDAIKNNKNEPVSELIETETEIKDIVQSLINMGISVHDFDAQDTSKEGLVEQLYVI